MGRFQGGNIKRFQGDPVSNQGGEAPFQGDPWWKGGGGPAFVEVPDFPSAELISPQPGDRVRLITQREFVGKAFAAGSWRWFWREIAVEPPPQTGWTWVNQGGATQTNNAPVLTMNSPSSAGLDIHGLVRSVPATPWTLRAWFRDHSGDSRSSGLLLRESSTGELYRWGWVYAVGGGGLSLYFNTSPTGGTTNIRTSKRGGSTGHNAGVVGLEIQDDGVDLFFNVIMPGGNVFTMQQEGRTSRMAGGPDQFGIHTATSSALTTQLDLVSWDVS